MFSGHKKKTPKNKNKTGFVSYAVTSFHIDTDVVDALDFYHQATQYV